jgi:hypothetical protein
MHTPDDPLIEGDTDARMFSAVTVGLMMAACAAIAVIAVIAHYCQR